MSGSPTPRLVMTRPDHFPRPAVSADDPGLRALAQVCPMAAKSSVCVAREPDFFTLSRLEGNPWEVAVVDAPTGEVVGCIGLALRRSYLNGRAQETGYAGDLKVHPAWRGQGIGDALVDHGRRYFAACDPVLPVLALALAGNEQFERRAGGPRGLPRLSHLATIRAHHVAVIGPRPSADPAGLTVRRAEPGDLGAMVDLWADVGPRRQYAPVIEIESWAAFMAGAPGLGIGSFLTVHDGTGRLRAFAALWDQHEFKQTVLLRLSRAAAAFRLGFNALSRLSGGASLAGAGQPLRYLSLFNLCAAPEEENAFRALLLAAFDHARARGFPLFTVGLDVRDPLCRAIRGFWHQDTDIRAYGTTPRGIFDLSLDDRPVHVETALV
jgi:GNAT superfamily N-acetyltransferase